MNLTPQITQALTNLKIESLNPMQETAIESWREGKDLILLSPTGSGKTLAYLLPLLETLQPDVKGVQAVVLVPSRELALQIDQVFKSLNTPYKVMSCYGGRPAMEEHRTMKGINPSVIIGTPGRMNDHLGKQNFEAADVQTLIIDEFDKCLEFGFQDEMATVIGQLPRLKRRFLLSATDAEEIPRFTGLNQTLKLNFLSVDEPISERIHQVCTLSDMGGCTSDQENVCRADDGSSAELGGCGTCCNLSLVGVVVEDVAVFLLVHPAERLGDLLGECVGHTVRVTDSFPLDDLDIPHGYGDLIETLNIDVF